MARLLKRVTVRDFRSIRGEIAVDLDAPVVLIHGQNGVGKTSLLSAIELGLTSDILSLRRIDTGIMKFLPNRDAGAAGGKVILESADERFNKPAEIFVSAEQIRGKGLLNEQEARFFNERCYLAQSTLSRLLEIYQQQETRQSDSALTRFVKELLGLYRYDALINGLHAAGDVRRLREPAPHYWSARAEIAEIQTSTESLNKQRSELAAQVQVHELGVVQQLEIFDPSLVWRPLDIEAARMALNGGNREADLSKVARARRDATAASDQLKNLAAGQSGPNRQTVEQASISAESAFQQWQSSTGVPLSDAIKSLSAFISISSVQANPEAARSDAVRAAQAEIARVDKIISDDAAVAARVQQLMIELAASKARGEVLDSQIAVLSGTNASLVTALSAVAAHIHTDDCPVCGRDYSEISHRTLSEHVSEKIATLVEASGRLQSLAGSRASTTTSISVAERELGSLSAKRVPPPELDALKKRRVQIDELRSRLTALAREAGDGEKLANSRTSMARVLAELNARDQSLATLLAAIGRIATEMEVVEDGTADVRTRVEALTAELTKREELLAKQQSARSGALTELAVVAALRAELGSCDEAIQKLGERRLGLAKAKAISDQRLEAARDLVAQVLNARTAVVRDVFNGELNAVWRDLFVRLAPDEKFVPAFAVPEPGSGPVEAVLETHYRSGGKGGNPRAMLSAGNLNTAALTLFLALHLSVRPILPCLIIDDPVQSMDEVHIAQLAALLRTLSKQKERQVIVAVHERSLFEYLSLELSPAYEGDRLVTVELGRAADGMSTVRWDTKTYEPDRAIAA